MNSERRMSFSRFRSNAIYFQQLYASISYSRIQVLLSVRSYRPILVFEYQRYGLLSQCFSCLYIFHETKIYFSSVFNVLGDFLLFNRPAVVVDLVHSHLFTLQFSQSYFSALKHFNYYYSHATSQRQFNAASSWAIAASCFCSNYSYSNYRVTFYATRDWRGSSIYILITNWGFYKQAFVMVNSVIIRKIFTPTIIMPAFLKFLFWMSSDWLHFSDSKFHTGHYPATQ